LDREALVNPKDSSIFKELVLLKPSTIWMHECSFAYYPACNRLKECSSLIPTEWWKC